MKLSVLIPTHNRRHLLAQTLPTLFAQQFSPDHYEIIVVVDGSTDGTAEWLRSLSAPCGLSIITQPNGGLIAARNTALQAARGEVVLILDDDIECPPNFLGEHVAAHVHSDRVVAFGHNALSPRSPKNIFTQWARSTAVEWLADLQQRGARWPEDAELGANYSSRRELLLELGGWNLQFRTRELEFGLRLWKSGVAFRFLPRATAYHIYDKSDDMVRVDAKPYGCEEVRLCRIHPEYRAASALASIEEGKASVRLLRYCFARAPFEPDLLLRPWFWVASALRGRAPVCRLALRLLNLRHSMAMLRGGLSEVGSARAYHQEFTQRLPVLAYHHVGPKRTGTHPGLTVSPTHFDRQIKGLLRRGCTPVSAEEWYAWVCRAAPLPRRPVLITFDDAYADLAEHAFPVLQRYGCVALVFAATSTLGGTNAWDEQVGWGTHRILTAGQVRHWARQGISFGVHSRTHPDLRDLSDQSLEEEVAGAKRDLAQILGGEPRAFAYPYGYCDERVRNCVARHFDLAFTIDPRWNTLATDRFRLGRFVVNPGDGWFGLAARVWFDSLQRVRDVIALRSRIRAIRDIIETTSGETAPHGT